MRSILKTKKGALGLNTTKSFVITILSLAVISMAVLITLGSLDNTSVATDATKNLTANVSEGITNFFENAGTFFTLLAVAVIILIISVVIMAVNRFGGASDGL